jgi:type IV pilus assembly protein PilB
MAPQKLGEILLRLGLIRPDQLQIAVETAFRNKTRLTSVLISLNFLKENQILKALEKNFTLPGVDAANFQIDNAILTIVSKDFCEKNLVIPISKANQTLVVAFADPGNLQIRDDLRFLTKLKISPVVATENSIILAIEKNYGAVNQSTIDINRQNQAETLETTTTMASVNVDDNEQDNTPIVKFVNGILIEAMRKRTSDIHFEPFEKTFKVRFRVDGNLIETTRIDGPQAIATAASIAARIKIMSKMDISEKRRPQDGRLKIKLSKENKEMDFRVSTIPTMWGEKICMRLLDKSNLQLDMTKLGFEEDDLRLFKDKVNMPQGMVLITGPTGSGKTTTIYSALAELNKPDVNISTAEDPIEFNLEGINQVQMNNDIELNFSTALRAFLRQDPDVIMLGEIRDLETAEIAFKAASTGHLVVSTLHTNDASSTVIRLKEMGVAPYLISSTVNLIVAQRLVGRVCESCKEPISVPEETIMNLGVSKVDVPKFKLMKGRGCMACANTGIKGRLAIYELLPMTEKIKNLVLEGGNASQIRNMSRESGLKTLRRSALLKLARGQTTVEEVLNASVSDVS